MRAKRMKNMERTEGAEPSFNEIIDVSDDMRRRRGRRRKTVAMRVSAALLIVISICIGGFPAMLQYRSAHELSNTSDQSARAVAGWPYPQADDAIAAAKARGRDVIIVDTAGRLHNKANLMNELSKIRRVIDRELPDASVECLMVLDATTGQNGLIQAKVFGESAGLTGIVLTKLDGTAKGGIVFAIKRELGLPVKFIGVGEGVNDLKPFVPEEFAEALLE